MTLSGATAVVTGASRGLGAAVVRAFADAGASVFACARNRERLEAVADGLREADGSVTTMRADVRDEFDVERFAETAAREGDGIDVVVANAGVYHGTPGETPLADESYAAFDDTVRTNVRGAFATVRECIPHLNEDARVLVPSGELAADAKAGYGAYAVSKAAAEGLVRQFAAEEPQTFAVVHPGQLSTDLTGGGPGRDPEDVAGLFRWAAADADAESIDGETVSLREWMDATRS